MVTSKLTKSTGFATLVLRWRTPVQNFHIIEIWEILVMFTSKLTKSTGCCNMSFMLAYTCSKLSYHRNMGNFSNGDKQNNKEYWLLQHEFYAGVHLFKTFTS